jgi:acetylxylan esterase
MIWFGDPRFIPSQPFNAGNATTAGIFPRQSYQLCTRFSPVLRSYCDETDIFCASGDSLETHLGYFAKYSVRAAAFVDQRLKLSGVRAGKAW